MGRVASRVHSMVPSTLMRNRFSRCYKSKSRMATRPPFKPALLMSPSKGPISASTLAKADQGRCIRRAPMQ